MLTSTAAVTKYELGVQAKKYPSRDNVKAKELFLEAFREGENSQPLLIEISKILLVYLNEEKFSDYVPLATSLVAITQDPLIQIKLGDIYRRGKVGVPINLDEAKKWYELVEENKEPTTKKKDKDTAQKGLELINKAQQNLIV